MKTKEKISNRGMFKPGKALLAITVMLLGGMIVVAQKSVSLITRDEAVAMALKQASNYEQAKLNEGVVSEDIFQARKAFYPKVTANPGIIYTTPSLSRGAGGVPRPPSFLGANAISEFQGIATASGEIDTSGRLKALKKRAELLLENAKAGTETARRDLIRATDDAYYGLSFAAALEKAAEINLQTAVDFENTTKLLVEGGENAPVDVVRAQIQTATLRDELEKSKTNKMISRYGLNLFLNLGETVELETENLQIEVPIPGELAQFTADEVKDRPELAQFDAQKRVAEKDAEIARSERRPQITYSVDAGLISDSLRPVRLRDSAGVRATVGVTIPLLDWGGSKSRQTQAELQAKIAESSKLFAERQFMAEFRSNMDVAASSSARIRALAGNLDKAEKVLEVAIERYKAGETQIIEVTESQNLVVAQRQALLQAIYDYQIAKARLRQATGK